MSIDEVQIIHSKRASIGITLDRQGKILLRVPLKMPNDMVQNFLNEQEEWVQKSIQKMQKRKAEQEGRPKMEKLTKEQLIKLKEQAEIVIPKLVSFYSLQVRASYGEVTIRCQKTRWGSCSAQGNLSFNCLLLNTPKKVLDYVIIHELCHRHEMNHSKKFWELVERYCPDYKEAKEWLSANGSQLMESAFN